MDFVQALNYCKYAVYRDRGRLAINDTVCLEGDRMIATDGHRMHVAKIDGLLPGVSIPKAGIRTADAEALAYAFVGPIEKASITDDHVEIFGPGHVGRAPLNPDRFPDWGLVVPQPSKTPFRVKAKDLRAAIRACRINDRKVESKGVRFLIDEDGIMLQPWLKTKDKDTGKVELLTSRSAFAPWLGIPNPKAFVDTFVWMNQRYLEQAITGMQGSVEISIEKSLYPVLITSDDRTAVVMPMRGDD